MKIWGDLFEIQPHFLTMMDFKIQYPDIYLTFVTDENDEPIDGFIGEKAWFSDENCWVWEVIDNLSCIMQWTGADGDVIFWEDDEDEL
jgi:hypothetical protein